MKTRMAWLLFGLAALTIPFAESLSCYDCRFDGQTGHGLPDSRTTCPESLTPSEAATCQGQVCLITWSVYGSQGHGTSLACLDKTFVYSGSVKVDQCLLLNTLQFEFKFVVYNDMCCFTKSETRDASSGSSILHELTTCVCDKDYCNGNATAYKNKPPRSAMNIDDTTAMSAASFAKWRRPSDQCIYGFSLMPFIVALPFGLYPEVQ